MKASAQLGPERPNWTAIGFLKSVKSGIGIEPFVWIGALLWFGITGPGFHSEFSICPLKLIGFEHCPGCGLGQSIAFALRGQLADSIHTHILGIPAILILVHRVIYLVRNYINQRRVTLNISQSKEQAWQT